MSVQNGERLATKQDLADMYQGILPYLGGMPEMLANKFSKGDLYSTDEKMIGQWIDGKPLYQKVFSVVDTGNSGTHTITIPSTLNIESVVYFKAEKVCDGYGISIPYTESNHVITVSKPVTSGDIVFTKDTATVWSGTYYLTMKYTKTTDSAISIGSDTDYSTEEKIVGTWIDSKPLYQKVVVTACPNNAQGVYPHNISNIDKIVDIRGGLWKNQLLPINMTGSEQSTNTNGIRASVTKDSIVIRTFFDGSTYEGVWILQYTKTT